MSARILERSDLLFEDAQFIDELRRSFERALRRYTWWSQRFGIRERNIGWRLDYFFVSPDLRRRVRDAFIESEVRGSDHCPVGLKLR